MVQRLACLYEGKAKRVYSTEDPQFCLIEFKDDATAFNGAKRGVIEDKGAVNSRVSAVLFRLLEDKGIPTHFVELTGQREMLVKKLDIIKVEVVVRNIAAGSLAKRLGLAEGTVLPIPVLEHYYKSDELGDPMINEYHIRALNLASEEQLREMEKMALAANGILKEHLAARGLVLVDFKLEFGVFEGKVLVGDEISPDTCRLWDAATNEKLDKDRFRRNLGDVEGAYREVLRRLSD